MVSHPGLSVKDVMTIAKFTDEEIEDKSMQRKVLRRLPGKGKRAMMQDTSDNSIVQSIDVGNENTSDVVSPITEDSATSDGKSNKKSRRMTVSRAHG